MQEMNYDPIQTPIDWHAESPPIGAPRNRKMHVSSCGRVKIIPKHENGGDIAWKIVVDDIDLNHTGPMLARQKRFVHAHLLRTRGRPLEEKTVVWIYFEPDRENRVPRKPVGVRYRWLEDIDEMAKDAAGLKYSVKVHRRIVSPRQDRLD